MKVQYRLWIISSYRLKALVKFLKPQVFLSFLFLQWFVFVPARPYVRMAAPVLCPRGYDLQEPLIGFIKSMLINDWLPYLYVTGQGNKRGPWGFHGCWEKELKLFKLFPPYLLIIERKDDLCALSGLTLLWGAAQIICCLSGYNEETNTRCFCVERD